MADIRIGARESGLISNGWGNPFLSNCDKIHGFPSSVTLIPASSRGATRTSDFLSRRSRGIDPHLEFRRGKRGSSSLVAGNSVFLSSGDGYLGKLLEFHKGCQVPFRVPRRNVCLLWKCCSVKGPHLACRAEFRGMLGVMVGTLGFLSSCMSTCWTTHVSSGKSGVPGRCKGQLGIPCASLHG